jgi:hypothetical protein
MSAVKNLYTVVNLIERQTNGKTDEWKYGRMVLDFFDAMT